MSSCIIFLLPRQSPWTWKRRRRLHSTSIAQESTGRRVRFAWSRYAKPSGSRDAQRRLHFVYLSDFLYFFPQSLPPSLETANFPFYGPYLFRFSLLPNYNLHSKHTNVIFFLNKHLISFQAVLQRLVFGFGLQNAPNSFPSPSLFLCTRIDWKPGSTESTWMDSFFKKKGNKILNIPKINSREEWRKKWNQDKKKVASK